MGPVWLVSNQPLCLSSGLDETPPGGLSSVRHNDGVESTWKTDWILQILPTEENFLLFFRQQLKSCAEFMQAWRCYDADHSGYIEADELKNFLKDLLQKAKKPYDEKKLDEYTHTTLKIFDSNHDGKLCLAEMARLLPDEENFLLKFQNVKMVRREFNKIFELYDQDENGYMDENELDALLKDLCEKNKKVLEVNKIPTYKTAIMALSDGGKLYRTELALVLCAEDISAPAPL
uniref:Calbindin n=1 Tax=Hucho hucho TaxID=62062 RepID=A0A4W5N2J4_9TELE